MIGAQVMIDAVSGLLDRLLASYDEVKEKGGVDGNGNLNEEAVEEMQEIVYGHVEAEYATVLEKVPSYIVCCVLLQGHFSRLLSEALRFTVDITSMEPLQS